MKPIQPLRIVLALALMLLTPVAEGTTIVTTNSDNGPGSLRQAVLNADASVINFATNLSGQTITLTTGAIEISATVTIDASALAGGIQINGGGASSIFLVDNGATVLLNALVITNGYDNDDPNYGGGGILNLGTLTLTNCTISGNTCLDSYDGGGGIDSYGTLTLNQCTLTGNSQNNWVGGALDVEAGTATVNQCTISGNVALETAAGGAMGIDSTGTLIVNQSAIMANTAIGTGNTNGGGAAVWNSGGQLVLNECTVQGNDADGSQGGGGLVINGGTLTINQTTLCGNSANNSQYGGGGILSSGTVMATNSIIAGNSADNSQGVDIANLVATLTFGGSNLLQSAPYNYAGTVNGAYILAAPNLAAPGYYGGPTQTMPPLPSSPAIDACSSGTSFTTDQRGFPRVVGPYADIGAVELQSPAASAPKLKTLAHAVSGGGSNSPSAFQFTFTNATECDFTVLTSTDLSLSFTNWTVLGEVMQSAPGQYEFTDPQAATNYPQRFYVVRSP